MTQCPATVRPRTSCDSAWDLSFPLRHVWGVPSLRPFSPPPPWVWLNCVLRFLSIRQVDLLLCLLQKPAGDRPAWFITTWQQCNDHQMQRLSFVLLNGMLCLFSIQGVLHLLLVDHWLSNQWLYVGYFEVVVEAALMSCRKGLTAQLSTWINPEHCRLCVWQLVWQALKRANTAAPPALCAG